MGYVKTHHDWGPVLSTPVYSTGTQRVALSPLSAWESSMGEPDMKDSMNTTEAVVVQDAVQSALDQEHPVLDLPEVQPPDDAIMAPNIWAKVEYEAPFFVLYVKNAWASWWPFSPWRAALRPDSSRSHAVEVMVQNARSPGSHHAVTSSRVRPQMRFATYYEARSMATRLGLRL